jgi:hypothetical protein
MSAASEGFALARFIGPLTDGTKNCGKGSRALSIAPLRQGKPIRRARAFQASLAPGTGSPGWVRRGPSGNAAHRRPGWFRGRGIRARAGAPAAAARRHRSSSRPRRPARTGRLSPSAQMPKYGTFQYGLAKSCMGTKLEHIRSEGKSPDLNAARRRGRGGQAVRIRRSDAPASGRSGTRVWEGAVPVWVSGGGT